HALEETIDEHSRPAPRVAVDHHAGRILSRDRDRFARGPAHETRIAVTEDDSLKAAIAGYEIQAGRQKWSVVLTGLRIEQVNACRIAFAALRRFQPSQAAHSEKLAAHATPVQFAYEEVKA